jgi:polyferredoxin
MSFDKLIIPSIMKGIYLLVAVFIALGCLAVMFVGGGRGFIVGLFGLVVSELFWRIICEAMLVMCLIYDELKALNGKLGNQPKETAEENAKKTVE